jgi:hypothetical protein
LVNLMSESQTSGWARARIGTSKLWRTTIGLPQLREAVADPTTRRYRRQGRRRVEDIVSYGSNVNGKTD